MTRGPAQDSLCKSYGAAFLYHSGFHALQLQRAAHNLWESGSHGSALRLQALGSIAFGADIHPGARFGRGVLLVQPMGKFIFMFKGPEECNVNGGTQLLCGQSVPAGANTITQPLCTGVVIGEAAVVGNHVTLMQYVTLGGTGKDSGDRHPKLADHVFVGAKATIIGVPLAKLHFEL